MRTQGIVYYPQRRKEIICSMDSLPNYKISGEKINHHYLKKKLIDLWKLQSDFSLIDLGLEFFTVKFTDEDSQKKVIQEGPWFVAWAYLSIRVWEPNFVPSKSQIDSTAIWVRLPQLPTEF